ncbi:MAG: hypothetical protein JJU20_10205 [Opitutales bacterium]|nr:hypothetical protein [Opitutales bacterium]
MATSMAASTAATTVSTLMRIFMVQLMVMLALYISALTSSYRGNPGRCSAKAVQISWGLGLRIAATLIPAFLREGFSPAENFQVKPA